MVPDDEVAATARVSPHGWKQGHLVATPEETPSLCRPPIQVDGEGVAAPVRAEDDQRSRHAALHQHTITRPFQKVIGVSPMGDRTAVSDSLHPHASLPSFNSLA